MLPVYGQVRPITIQFGIFGMLVLINCDYVWTPIEIRDGYGWVGGSVKYGVTIVGYFNVVFQFGSSYCDVWCGACIVMQYGLKI